MKINLPHTLDFFCGLVTLMLVLGCQDATLPYQSRSALDSDNDLSGSLSGVLEAGTYNVVGNISVASGQTLTITAPAVLSFSDFYTFTIYGTLIAEGDPQDSVIFNVAYGNQNRWGGIRFYSASSNSVLRYVRISGGKNTGSEGGGGLYVNNCSPTIEHVRVNNCSALLNGGGAKFVYCNSTLDYCRFDHNYMEAGGSASGGGLMAYANGYFAIKNSEFDYNADQNGSGIYLSGTGESALLENLLVHHNQYSGT